MSDRFITVTREQFFAYVNPRDIVLRTEPAAVYWETRGRTIVGYSTPGYKCESAKTWHLHRDAEALCQPVRGH
jgi:hypothetical protein